MGKILEVKAYLQKFYANYSRFVDIGLRFILAVLIFTFVDNHVGFIEVLSNPLVIVGLAVICTFLPATMTAIFASVIVMVQFFTLAPGVAIISGLIFITMFALYFRFAPGKATVLLLTPLAFAIDIPILVPVLLGLTIGPSCVVPIIFGTIVYYMIAYVKSYATVVETVAESGMLSQITAFTQQLFSNKEMWMIIISFTICLLLVHNIRQLSVDHTWETATVAGVLANLIMMTFGHVMMDISVSYVSLILGSIVVVIVAIILKFFVFSVDYSRSEYMQFEDDEYYYYVKAVPKVSIAIPEKTVKTINVRQKTEVINTDEVQKALEEPKTKATKEEIEESEIQKLIEEALNK